MWIPGYQYYFNQGVTNDTVTALARAYMQYSVPEAHEKPGIPNPGRTIYSDVVTLDLLVRPRIAPTPIQLTPYNYNIVTVNPGLPGGSA